jgi:hypothetical protein
MAHNLLRKASGKSSMRSKRKAAGWDDDFLAAWWRHKSFTRFPCNLATMVAH